MCAPCEMYPIRGPGPGLGVESARALRARARCARVPSQRIDGTKHKMATARFTHALYSTLTARHASRSESDGVHARALTPVTSRRSARRASPRGVKPPRVTPPAARRRKSARGGRRLDGRAGAQQARRRRWREVERDRRRVTDAAWQTRVPMSDAAVGGVAVAAGVHEWRRRAGRRALALGRVRARRRKPLDVLVAGRRHPGPTRGARWNRRRRTRKHAPGASACVRHLARLEREFVARVASRARQRVARRRGCARRHCGGGVLAPEHRAFLREPPVHEEGGDPRRSRLKASIPPRASLQVLGGRR